MNDITDLAARVRELEADRDSWRDQADQRVKDWDDMRQRAERAEAKYEDEIQMWRNACELMNRAEAERDALRPDAERYRWLRSNTHSLSLLSVDANPSALYHADSPTWWNTVIDAALAAEGKT